MVVHGFDTNPNALGACGQLAELNGVKARVHPHGACTHRELAALLTPKTLIVCDCEGCESEFLDPGQTPALRHTDILVELHDRVLPGISKVICERFAASHHVTLIASAERLPDQFPPLQSWNEKDQRLALDEFRGGPMHWAFS